jgi:biopolymer transport protein TolQ
MLLQYCEDFYEGLMFMFDFIVNSPLVKVIVISDWISKYIILFGLLLLSIVSVAVIIFKFLSFRFQLVKNKNLLALIRKSNTMKELSLLNIKFFDCSGGRFLHQILKRSNEIISDNIESKVQRVSPLLQQEIENVLVEEERFIPFLSMCSTVSPLIGLFGTIWGLIQSFISISQEKSADITIVAPGIASALFTTLFGLLVAIPAMIASHFFIDKLRNIEVQLSMILEEYLVILRNDGEGKN